VRLRCRAYSALLAAPFILLPLSPGSSRADVSPQLLSYRWTPDKPLTYKITANIKGSLPILDSPEPVDLKAVLTLVYSATPRAALNDGSASVEFRVVSADAEIADIPFPIPLEEAQKVLDQRVSIEKTGAVKSVQGGEPLPFSLSIPGVDPKRLYTMLFPIVFPDSPVRPGDTWSYKSELLGEEGKPKFTAKLLPSAGSSTGDRRGKSPETGAALRLQQNFSMDVDQKLDEEKRPVQNEGEVYRTRKGRIQGNGTYTFHRTRGIITAGEVNVSADIVEEIVGTPKTPEEPKKVVSKVHAKVTIQLQDPETQKRKQSAPPSRKEK
jgi:hypothetical protein